MICFTAAIKVFIVGLSSGFSAQHIFMILLTWELEKASSGTRGRNGGDSPAFTLAITAAVGEETTV